MKHVLFLCFVLLLTFFVSGQTQKADSLVNVLKTEKLSPEKELEIYNFISFVYVRNDPEKGLEYTSKGLELAQKANNKKFESSFYKNFGVIYFYESNYDTARIYLDKALSLAMEIGDTPLEIEIYVELGNLYYYRDHQMALDFYLKGLSLKDQNQPDRATAVLLSNIAAIHRSLNNLDRALSFYEQSLAIGEQLSLNEIIMYAYNGLGTVYADKGETDKAIAYLQNVLLLNKSIGNKYYEMATLATLSAQYSQKKQFELSLKYSQDAVQIAEEIGSTRDLCNILSVMADNYLDIKNFRESERIGLRVWETDSSTIDIAGPIALTLSIAYIHLGEKDKAEYFVYKHNEIVLKKNDEILHESLAEMEVKYESEKKELRIASLEKERRLYIWLAVTGILLLLVSGVVLLQKIKNEKKKRQLTAANAIQEGEMGERERLAGQLHDRLGGTLSAVKSELNSTKNIERISDKLDECIEEVRRISHNMMPLSLRFGIKTALEDFAAQFTNVFFHYFGTETGISKSMEFVVYCCANELVTNALRHSGAKLINIQLIQEEKRIALIIQDDGEGFDEKSVKRGFGLKNIYDRVASCDGKIEIISSVGKGTEISIEFKH